jgi:hypothetical protein
MADTKALTGGSGGGGGGLGGGCEEEMAVPRGARAGQGWMAGWMGRLGARTQRRGSLGFSDGGQGGGTPPARMGSVDEFDQLPGWEQQEAGGRSLAKVRNDSYPNFLATSPGSGDQSGDQFHFRQRLRWAAGGGYMHRREEEEAGAD